MEGARRPRLRLSRRRPPDGGGLPNPRPGPLSDGDGESARLWSELLRTASADLSVDGELPPLPAFSGQEPTRDTDRAASPEVFTVGSKTFTWTPLPPAPRGGDSPGRFYSGSPAQSSQESTSPEPREVPSTQEQPAVDGAQTLQSCPMCQADFAPGLAQLDIDSHLAQCLADSTEDMVW